MPKVRALRTPDQQFINLPDFPYPPKYVETLPGYEGLRTHYLDLGPRDAPQTFLCLHGEPTWCYLYRKMIPVMLASGARIIAPDFLGFGRSDKPASVEDYTFHFHRNFLLRFTEYLDLKNITLVVQDWGGMLGLTLPADAGFRARLSRLIVMNTVIPVGTPLDPSFYEWRQMVRTTPDLQVGAHILSQTPHLSKAEVAAYDVPFPDVSYKCGVRSFPDLVMVEPGMEGIPEAMAASSFWSTDWNGQTFMAIGETDTNLGLKTMLPLRDAIQGCPEPLLLKDAGHFVQEWGEPVATAALRAFGDI
jgi:haloalkane dehalogenase